MTAPSQAGVAVKAEEIIKQYGPVVALNGVSIELG
jgi:hypothetical protein